MNAPGRKYWTALFLVLLPAPAAAQAANVLLSEGLRAYTSLDFAAAAQLLRRSLEPSGSAALTPPDRLRALMYLGASNVFRDERDQAVVALRELVLAEPRFRPDSLVFPPRITQVFAEVLQTTKVVGLAAPAEIHFSAGSPGLGVSAYATSRHRIDALVRSAGGAVAATLYRGTIEDSTVLSWDGLDSTGSPVAPGRYDLVVTSSLAPDQVLRSVLLPLSLSVRTADTLPWPAAAVPAASRWDLRWLVPGAALGLALAAPAAAGLGGAKGVRVGLGLSLAAVAVALARPKPSAPRDSAAAAWRSRLKTVQQENERRRRRPTIVIRTGTPELRDGPRD